MKKKFMVTNDYSSSSVIPVDWNMLPESLIQDVSREYLINTLGVLESGELIDKTVLLLEPVRKFGKNVKLYEDDNLQIGVIQK